AWARDRVCAVAVSDGGVMWKRGGGMRATAAACGLVAWYERNLATVQDETIRFASVVPSLVAALWRLGRGLDPVVSDPRLGHVENYLWMLFGTRPRAAQVTAAQRYLILTAEHGMNASTVTARVIGSPAADADAAPGRAGGAP